jgi:AcrR family transcriptional regulator
MAYSNHDGVGRKGTAGVVAPQNAKGQLPDSSRHLRSDAARNRRQVLRAARGLLDTGDTTLPMNLIARQAGVGVGTVYRHFPTRRALLEALSQGSLETLVEEARLAAETPDPAKGLERLLHCALQCQLDDIGLATILSEPDFECPETLVLGAELGRSVTTILDRARTCGAIRTDIDSDDIRRLIGGVHHALRAGASQGAHLDRYLQVLLKGLQR